MGVNITCIKKQIEALDFFFFLKQSDCPAFQGNWIMADKQSYRDINSSE